MRNVFLALLLVNLLAWAGFSWFAPAERPVSRYDGPGITLVREADVAGERDSEAEYGSRGDGLDPVVDEAGLALGGAESAARETAGAAPDRLGNLAADAAATGRARDGCVAVGPFTEPADAEAAAGMLEEQGLSPREVVGEEEIWEGYWVYLEGIESNQRANEILPELRENGIAEAYVISESDLGIVISLGVFSETRRAATRAEQASGLGYQATISERTREAEARWLEVTVTGEQSIDIDALRPPGRISRIELGECA